MVQVKLPITLRPADRKVSNGAVLLMLLLAACLLRVDHAAPGIPRDIAWVLFACALALVLFFLNPLTVRVEVTEGTLEYHTLLGGTQSIPLLIIHYAVLFKEAPFSDLFRKRRRKPLSLHIRAVGGKEVTISNFALSDEQLRQLQSTLIKLVPGMQAEDPHPKWLKQWLIFILTLALCLCAGGMAYMLVRVLEGHYPGEPQAHPTHHVSASQHRRGN